MLAMKKADLISKSIEELWALHEEIASILASKMQAEKLKLEKRLDQLGRELCMIFGVLIPKFTRSSEIPTRPIRPGPVAASNRTGSVNCWRKANSWTTSGSSRWVI